MARADPLQATAPKSLALPNLSSAACSMAETCASFAPIGKPEKQVHIGPMRGALNGSASSPKLLVHKHRQIRPAEAPSLAHCPDAL